MPLVVNSNISSLNAQRQLLQSGAELDKASERLASGKRINSAADDAAGLAISNRQSSQIRGLDQAIRNANDGISLIQTAEGALDETTNILQRMRELSIQSANGIYSDTDRATIDAEVQQLKSEIDRIAETTAFNGQNILDGSLGDIDLQVGSEGNQTIGFSIEGFSASSLGGSGGDIVGEAIAGTTAGAVLGEFTALTGVTTAAQVSINDTVIQDLSGATNVGEALDLINSSLDGKGVEASTLVSLTSSSSGDGRLPAGTDFAFTLTDGNGDAQQYIITDTSTMDELVSKINDTTAVDASVDGDGRLTLSAANVTSIEVTTAADTAAGDFTSVDDDFGAARIVLTETGTNNNGIKFEIDGVTTTDYAGDLGIDANDNDGNIYGIEGVTTATALNEGDLIINGVEIGAIAATGADATAQAALVIQAINKLSDETGVVAYGGPDAGEVELSSTNGEISIAVGDNATAANVRAMTGLQERNSASGGGSIAGISVTSAANAQSAIDVIDSALEQINSTRADLGAINNRLDFTVSNLGNISENTSAARSRVVDADFASETAQLSRAQVLQQASQAMLAQANARPQQVLSLLQ